MKKTCEATISKNGELRQCRATALRGDRFCNNHTDRPSVKMNKIEHLLKVHGEDFFTNKEVRLEVQSILKGFRPRRPADRVFLKKLETYRINAKKEREAELRRRATMTHTFDETLEAWKDDAIDAVLAAAEQLYTDNPVVSTHL
jgi:hypothetical protein